MRLKEGRLFRADDTTSAIRPILVNETFAKTYFADGRPATRRRFTGMVPSLLGKGAVVDVVGLVEDMVSALFGVTPLEHRRILRRAAPALARGGYRMPDPRAPRGAHRSGGGAQSRMTAA